MRGGYKGRGKNKREERQEDHTVFNTVTSGNKGRGKNKREEERDIRRSYNTILQYRSIY